MIDWPWGDTVPTPYIRLSVFIVVVVLLYLLGPKVWNLVVGFVTQNIRLEGKQIEPFDRGPLYLEASPSNKDISLDLFEPEDSRDIAEIIARKIEEWARQNR